MKFIRHLLEQVEPLFKKGGKFEKLYPLFEANDTFLFTPGEVTKGRVHVRDAIDLKRLMSVVVVALIPCMIMAMYNTGFQANRIIAAAGMQQEELVAEGGNWRYLVMDKLGLTIDQAGDFYTNIGNPYILFSCLVHGALYWLPVYIVCLVAGGVCEVLFAIVRGHEINEGFLVTSALIPLTLPPAIPYYQVALGTIFGVVLGKEVFGGTGRNFLNPALTARAFLYFSYPLEIVGNQVWAAVDGYSGATALGALAEGEKSKLGSTTVSEFIHSIPMSFQGAQLDSVHGPSFLDAFFGNCHGSMGETSTFACLIGAAILIITGIGSWRIMAGCVIGAVAYSALLCSLGGDRMIAYVPPWWHLVIGGFAFGTVFMATDPVSASMTDIGKWIYGALVGFMTVLVRVVNPAFPEGIMLAILFANVCAPIIDYFVVQANIRRRGARYAKG